MKPLSRIRFIKIKTLRTSRAAQNVVETSHAADTGFNYSTIRKKKIDAIYYLSSCLQCIHLPNNLAGK